MKDYSELVLNAREFLKRTEECLMSRNSRGAHYHATQAVKELEDLRDLCLEMTREDQ